MLVFSLRRLVILIASFVALSSNAQQIHFIFLQTENANPFYVKLDNKVISSSSNGYVILPKLTDGDYNIVVGFPKNEFPEENFTVKIDKNDEGFLLKNFDNKGLGLFNLQSYAVTMAGSKPATEVVLNKEKGDAFSKMLANVVRDSSILQKNELVENKTIPTKVDTAIAAPIAIADTQLTTLSPPTKLSNKKNDDGIELVYVDLSLDKNDTIQIFMPYGNTASKIDSANDIIKNESIIKSELVAKPVNIDSSRNFTELSTVKKDAAIDDSALSNSKQIPDSTMPTKTGIVPLEVATLKDSAVKQENNIDIAKANNTTLPQAVKSSSTNSDCKVFANDGDFLKLRKKMASENSEDDMISIARKAFHSKCFSTEQVKNLSFLFLTNEGKYKFFDTTYPFVSDSNQFYTLESQITDSYYINRFKAMINK